jgi:hypothetical protein
MGKMISYCGLVCETCPIHLATLEEDILRKAEMRADIANQLSRIYGTTPKPEIVTDCDGCKINNGRLFTGCTDCEIRNCAINKKLANCAYCRDYICEKLERHYKYDPGSRDRLEEIRRNF